MVLNSIDLFIPKKTQKAKQCCAQSHLIYQGTCEEALWPHKEFSCPFYSQRYSGQHFVLQTVIKRTLHFEIWSLLSMKPSDVNNSHIFTTFALLHQDLKRHLAVKRNLAFGNHLCQLFQAFTKEWPRVCLFENRSEPGRSWYSSNQRFCSNTEYWVWWVNNCDKKSRSKINVSVKKIQYEMIVWGNYMYGILSTTLA